MSFAHEIKRTLFGRRRYQPGEKLEIYRCTDCGYVALTLGGLHAHIESHRPFWQFWRVGWDTDYLMERTERHFLKLVEGCSEEGQS